MHNRHSSAKECGDPFREPSETPILSVNIANHTVATLDGLLFSKHVPYSQCRVDGGSPPVFIDGAPGVDFMRRYGIPADFASL